MESIRASSYQAGNSVNLEGQYNTAFTYNYGDNYFQSAPQSNGSSLSEGLKTCVAFNALHNSEARYPQPNVLPGTRQEILQRLSSWCEQPFKKNRVFWVSGAAGVGKSALAQALSEKCTQTGQLAAAFFFSRNDSTRNKLDPFVATILYQLATSQVLKPLIAPLIDNIIGSMPGILHQTWETQFQELVSNPLAQIDPRSWSQLPHLVIIDGVDECIQVASQRRLLNMIQTSTPTLPLDFLVFSRPEPHISQVFNHESFMPPPSCLSLADFTESVREDIKLYLHHQFAHIQDLHWHTLPHPQGSWPGNSVIEELLNRATGQFIYVTTVIKYINYGKSPLTPTQRLNVILQAKRMANSSSPYPDLDLLYSQILQFCLNEDRKLQQILRLIVSPFGHYKPSEGSRHLQVEGSPDSIGYTSVWALEHLLELSQGEASALLSGLHSILNVSKIQTENVIVLHASFSEFLLDSDRAGMFYVGTKLSTTEWKELILACQIRLLSQIVKSEHWLKDSHDSSINGVFNTDIGSLNVWMNLKASTAINDKIVAALNAFDPYLYLTALLHWRYHTLGHSYKVLQHVPQYKPSGFALTNCLLIVSTHIRKLYNAFLLLEKTSKYSPHLQPFFERCRTFFQGFSVSFAPGQNQIFNQYILLACQLSLSCLSCPNGSFSWSKFGLFSQNSRFFASTSFTINGPLHKIDRQPSTIPEGWNTVYISSTEAQLLYRLLECLSSSQHRHIGEVLAFYEMEEWAYRLAQLDWERTKKSYLEGKKCHSDQIKPDCLSPSERLSPLPLDL